MSSLSLPWLSAPDPTLGPVLRALQTTDAVTWDALVGHANTRLDPMGILQLDRALRRLFPEAAPPGVPAPLRLALLGTGTHDHLLPSLRVGALRHGLHLQAECGDYDQCVLDAAMPGPVDVVLLALDARGLTAGLEAGADADTATAFVDAACARIVGYWRDARARGCSVIQQAMLPVVPAQFGNNEHRLPGSRLAALERIDTALRGLADVEGVHLLAIDRQAARDGIGAWHDPVLWHRGKQEVHPGAAPLYGELVGRLLGAMLGRSRKALVLDLDNTIWGGVVGDDGVDGLILGQGTALGEAFVDVQAYAAALARRGVILAVCSKNDEANALEPFDTHPDMVLRRGDIACFVANWADKATNLRSIAAQLRIGLDALVFVDDNPAERAIVRQELPMVAVPELPEDPAFYAMQLAEAGYFESVGLSDEDRDRTAQYQANIARASAGAAETDMDAYLASLEMVLHWSRIDALGAPRVVQLVNKTNQFNLTTRRTTEAAIDAAMADPATLTLQLRLVDRFGNSGLIGVVMGRREGTTLAITDWLMSCRVLQRGVEAATFNLLVAQGRSMGARRLVGTYLPTAKNGMVADLYPRLGFSAAGTEPSGTSRWTLDLADAASLPVALRYAPPLPALAVPGFAELEAAL